MRDDPPRRDDLGFFWPESDMPRVTLREADDFVIVKSVPLESVLVGRVGAFALTGPGLDPEGIPFVTVDAAIARGRAIAQNSRVSLWDATTKDAVNLVETYRR